MTRQLTKKQRKFVDAYVESGIGVKAALEAGYDTDYDGARSIASQNISKLHVRQEIEKAWRRTRHGRWPVMKRGIPSEGARPELINVNYISLP